MNSDTIGIQSAYHRTLRCSIAFCDTTHLNQLTSLPNDINHDTENQRTFCILMKWIHLSATADLF